LVEVARAAGSGLSLTRVAFKIVMRREGGKRSFSRARNAGSPGRPYAIAAAISRGEYSFLHPLLLCPLPNFFDTDVGSIPSFHSAWFITNMYKNRLSIAAFL
jgi:hypothetical protein